MSPAASTGLPDRAGADIGTAMRVVNQQRGSTPQQQEEALQAYQDNLRIRRAQAEQYAAAARDGVELPPDAADTLRNELEADIEQWRAEFEVGRMEWKTMRDRWLVERDSLTARQWAERRVEWWAARDAWLTDHLP